MSNPDQPLVALTRWWWVRHAPVREDGGNIYGQSDIDCDTSDREVFEAVAKIDRKSTRLNSSHITPSRMPSSA